MFIEKKKEISEEGRCNSRQILRNGEMSYLTVSE
jgi:hypothetical protein